MPRSSMAHASTQIVTPLCSIVSNSQPCQHTSCWQGFLLSRVIMASLLSYIPIFEYFTAQVCLSMRSISAYPFVYAQCESFVIHSFMHNVNPSPQHGAQVRILRSYGVRREAGIRTVRFACITIN